MHGNWIYYKKNEHACRTPTEVQGIWIPDRSLPIYEFAAQERSGGNPLPNESVMGEEKEAVGIGKGLIPS